MSNATWQIMQNSKSYSCNNDKMNVNFLCIHSFHKVIFTCISVCDIAYARILVENIWIFAPKIATRIFAVKITQFSLSHLNFRAKNCFSHAHKFKLIRIDSERFKITQPFITKILFYIEFEFLRQKDHLPCSVLSQKFKLIRINSERLLSQSRNLWSKCSFSDNFYLNFRAKNSFFRAVLSQFK